MALAPRHAVSAMRDRAQMNENKTQQEIDEMRASSRRDFLKTSGAVAAAAFAGANNLNAAPPHMPIGLQLYSVRNQLPHDFEGTLRQLHTLGYRVVEAAGYYNKPAGEFRGAMEQAGLRCISSHLTLELLRTKLDENLDYAHKLGLEYLVCSSAGGVHRDPSAKGEKLSLDDWRYVAGEFNRVGEKIKAAGMTFAVHNHTPEFAVENGTLVYDELLRLTDPKLVYFEMDCGWVQASGHDPVQYLRKSPERFPLMHVKDMEGTGKDEKSVVLGHGHLDYGPILAAATGLKQYFIEQEEFAGDPMTELREDAEYMRRVNA